MSAPFLALRSRGRVRAAAGLAPLGAGGIQAAAGDGQVTLTLTGGATGGSGSYTRTLYRSTTAGVLGTAVLGFLGTFPYTDTGLANGTTYRYTLRVSDGITHADTSQVSATPQAAGSGAILLVGTNFDSGAWAPLNTPTREGAQHYAIVDDPTGSGRGKVASLHYDKEAGSFHHDRNRSFTFNHDPRIVSVTGQGPDGMTFGSRCYWRGSVYLLKGTMSGFAPQYDQRKLLYVKFGDINSGALRHMWRLIAWGHPDGSRMDLHLTSGTEVSAGYPDFRLHEYGLSPLAWDTWHDLELEWQLNDAGVANGWIRVYHNGVQVHQRTNIMLVAPHPTNPALDRIFDFAIGDQQQGDSSTEASAFDAIRYWDDVAAYTERP